MSWWSDNLDLDSKYGLGSFNRDEDDLGIGKFLTPPAPRPYQPFNVPQPSEAPSVRYPDAIGPDGEITPPQLKQEYTSPMESLNVYDQLTDASKFQTLDSTRKNKHAGIWEKRLDEFKKKKLKPFYESFSDLMYEDAANSDDPDLENENYINQLDRGLADLQTSAGEEDTWRGASSAKEYAAGRLPDFDPWTSKNGLREQFIKLRDKAKSHRSTADASKEKSELMEEQLFNIPTAQKVLLDADLSNRKKDEAARFRDAAKAPPTPREELSLDKTNEMLDKMHFEDPDIQQGVLLNAGKIDPRTELEDRFSLSGMADQSTLDRRMSAARKGQDPSGVINRRNLTQKNRRLFNQGIMFSHPNNTSDGLNPRELSQRDTDLLDLDRMRKAGMTEYNGKPLEEMLDSLGGEERLYAAKILETVYQAKNNWQDAQLEYIAVAGSADAEVLRDKMMAAEELKNRTLVFAAKNGLDNELFDQAESIGWLSGLAQAAKTGWKLSQQANYSVDFLTNTLDADDQQKLIALNSVIADAPKSTSMERYQQATAKNPSKDLWHSISRLLFEHPDAASEMFVESMASFLPTTVKVAPFTAGAGAAIGGLLGRGKGAKFGAKWGAKLGAKLSWGVASLGLEVSGNTMHEMRELGINIKDPKIFAAAWANPVIREKIVTQALKKGVPIAIMDSFNALAAGKIAASFTKEGRELLAGGQLLNGRAWSKAQAAVPKFTRFQRGSAAASEFMLGDQATGMFGEYWGQSWEKEPGEPYDLDAIAAEGVVGMGPGMAGGILNYVQSRPSQVSFVDAPFHYSDMRETAEGTTGKLERAGWVEDVQTFNTADGITGKLMEEGGHAPGDYGSLMTQDMFTRLYTGVGAKVMPEVRWVFTDKRTPQRGGQNMAGALQQDREDNPVIYLNRNEWGESPFGVVMHESGHLARILMFPNDPNRTDGKRQSSRLLDIYDELPLAEKKDAWYRYRKFQGASDPNMTPEEQASAENSFADASLKYRADEWFAFQWAQVVAGGTVNKGVKGELKTFYDTIIKDFAAEWMIDPTTGGLAAEKGTKATLDTAVRSFILDKMGYDPMGIPQDKIVIDESSSATLTGPVYADDDVGLKRFIDDAQKEASASGIPVADLLKAVDALSGDTQTYDKWKETEAVMGSQYVEPQADLTKMLPTSAGSVEEKDTRYLDLDAELEASNPSEYARQVESLALDRDRTEFEEGQLMREADEKAALDVEEKAAKGEYERERIEQDEKNLMQEADEKAALADEEREAERLAQDREELEYDAQGAPLEDFTAKDRESLAATAKVRAEKQDQETAEIRTTEQLKDEIKRGRKVPPMVEGDPVTREDLTPEQRKAHRAELLKRKEAEREAEKKTEVERKLTQKEKLASAKAAKRKKAAETLEATKVKQDPIPAKASELPPVADTEADTLTRILDTHSDKLPEGVPVRPEQRAVKIEPSKEKGKYELTTVRAGLGDVRRTTYDTEAEAKEAKKTFEKDESSRVKRVKQVLEETRAFVRDDETFRTEAARVAKKLGSDVENVDRIKLGVEMMRLEELSKDSPWGIESKASALYDDVTHKLSEKETKRRLKRHENEFERISTTIDNRIQELDRLLKPEEGLPRKDVLEYEDEEGNTKTVDNLAKFKDEKAALESIKESMAPERSTIDWKDIPHPLLGVLEKDNSISPITLGEMAASPLPTARVVSFDEYNKIGQSKNLLQKKLKDRPSQSNPQKTFSELIRDYTAENPNATVYPAYAAFKPYKDLTAADMRMYLDAAGAAELERSRGAVGTSEMGVGPRKSGKGLQPETAKKTTGGFSIEAGTTLASMILYKLNKLNIGKAPQTTELAEFSKADKLTSLEDAFLDLAHAPGEKIAPVRSEYGKAIIQRANSQGEVLHRRLQEAVQNKAPKKQIAKLEDDIVKHFTSYDPEAEQTASESVPFATRQPSNLRKWDDKSKGYVSSGDTGYIQFRDDTSSIPGVDDPDSAFQYYTDVTFHDMAADATNTLKPNIDVDSKLGNLRGEDLRLSQHHPTEQRSQELKDLIAGKEATEKHGSDVKAKLADPLLPLGALQKRADRLKLALAAVGVENRLKPLASHGAKLRAQYEAQKKDTVTTITVGTADYAITVEDTKKLLANLDGPERKALLGKIHRWQRVQTRVNAIKRIAKKKPQNTSRGLTLPERIGNNLLVPSAKDLKAINVVAQKLADLGGPLPNLPDKPTKDEVKRSKLFKKLVTLREKFGEVYKEIPRNADLAASVTERTGPGAHGKFKKSALVETFGLGKPLDALESEISKKAKKGKKHSETHQMEQAERAVADITTARVDADGSTRHVINPEYAPHEGATVAIESATEAKDNVFTFVNGEWKAPPGWNVQRQQMVSAEEMLRISGMSLKDDSGKGISIKEDVPFTQNKYTPGHRDLQSDMAEQLEADQKLAKEAWIDVQNKKYTGSMTHIDSVSVLDVVDFLMNPRNSVEHLDNPMSSQVKKGVQRQLPGPPGGGNLVRVWDAFIEHAYDKLGIDSKNSPKLPTPKDPHVWKHDRSHYQGGTEAEFKVAPEGEPNVEYNVMEGSIYSQPTPHPDVMRAQMVPLIQAAIDAGLVPIASLTGMSPDAESQIIHSSDARQQGLQDVVQSPDGTFKQVEHSQSSNRDDAEPGSDIFGSDYNLENIQTSSLPADFGKLSALRSLVETFKKGGDKEYLKHISNKKGTLTESIINQAAPIRKLTDMILDNSNLPATHPMRDFLNTHSYWHAYFGKGYNEVERAERRFIEPIIDALREHSIDVETFGEYLLARAAPTRNKHLKLQHQDKLALLKKNVTKKGKETFNAFAKETRELGVPFSGITDETAAGVVQDLENDSNFMAFLNSKQKPLHKYYAMNKDALATKEEYGLIQGELGLNERARMEAAASYIDWASSTKDKKFSSKIDTGDSYSYAPMQGFEGETQDLFDHDAAFQALGQGASASGKGWDQSRRKLITKGAFGRHIPKGEDGVYAPDPKAVMATTIEQFYNDKITSTKNEVANSFGDLFTFMRYVADPEAKYLKGNKEAKKVYDALLKNRPEFKTLADSLNDETKAGISKEFSKIFKIDFEMMDMKKRYKEMPLTPEDEAGNELHRLRTTRTELDKTISDSAHIFTYRVKGVPMYIEFKNTPEGATMAATLQNLKYQALPAVLGGFNTVTRYLAQTYTSMNPAFIIPNFFRDLGTAAVHLTEDHKSVIAKDIFSPSGMLTVGGYMKAVYSAERKKNKGESILSTDITINTETAKDLLANGTKEQQYQFALAAGAKVGYFRHDTVAEQITALQKKLKGEARLKQVAGSTLKLVDHMNTAVENSIRMTTFWSAIKNNYTVKQATDIARNVTVDFNQKGNLTQAFGSLYVFFGASMTSMNRLWRTFARRSPAQRAALVSGIVGAGMITSLFNRLMDPEEEDDDEPDYDSISSYKRDTNLIVPMPEGFPGNDKRDTGYFSVPVPLGYNMFWTLGQVMGDVLSSQMGLGNTTGVMEPMSRIMERSMNTFNPVGGSNFVSAGIPSAWMPIYELLGSNEDFMGNPIKYDDVSYSGKTPAHTRDPKGTPEHWTEASRWINEFMGGSETQKGSAAGMVGGNPLMYSEDHDIKFDMAGNQMKHLFYGYTGGIGKLLDQSFGGLLRAASGETGFDDYGDVPILGRFVRGTTYGANTRSAFSSLRSAVKTAEASKREAGELGTAMANRYRIDNRALLSLSKDVKYMDALRKKIREMKAKIESRKDLSADRRDTLLEAAEEQELKAMIKIVKKARRLNFKA